MTPPWASYRSNPEQNPNENASRFRRLVGILAKYLGRGSGECAREIALSFARAGGAEADEIVRILAEHGFNTHPCILTDPDTRNLSAVLKIIRTGEMPGRAAAGRRVGSTPRAREDREEIAGRRRSSSPIERQEEIARRNSEHNADIEHRRYFGERAAGMTPTKSADPLLRQAQDAYEREMAQRKAAAASAAHAAGAAAMAEIARAHRESFIDPEGVRLRALRSPSDDLPYNEHLLERRRDIEEGERALAQDRMLKADYDSDRSHDPWNDLWPK